MVMSPFAQLELQCDGLEQMRNVAPVGAELNQHTVRPGSDAAPAQVGDRSLRVGGQRARAEGDPDTRSRFSGGDIEDVGGNRGQRVHNPTTSSGLTGARRSSRPVAWRSAATTAAGTTTVEGSPTPLAP